MKIPHRCMFTTQLVGTLVVGMMNLAGLHPEIPWTSPKFKVTFDTFVIWGVIGPERIFGSGVPYALLYLVGIGDEQQSGGDEQHGGGGDLLWWSESVPAAPVTMYRVGIGGENEWVWRGARWWPKSVAAGCLPCRKVSTFIGGFLNSEKKTKEGEID
ncbi:unnamed protein product [Lactuca virosa]|uniref:Uncharacterized protein n=1 Tax=Lactuca virosa TaxID=75947 RepID=A0AAU9MKZ5_9ASTR|nr:unnamed protein product [Lactuca virosa]